MLWNKTFAGLLIYDFSLSLYAALHIDVGSLLTDDINIE